MPTPATKPEALTAWDAAVSAYRFNPRNGHREAARAETVACGRLYAALVAIGVRYPAMPYSTALGR